ncbi:acyltransferase family protein [Roseisolibacter agri]|uniref:Acyltransferase 3 domain-containing protein n=1 Tax=Roseisolibacter agri TaxID=2014610 RepID=A0AA37V8Y6_9BACT|nr:acyltransferase [Roseisolibacter agri]GLC28316.1 hypothetical protein rosag_48290 [Roseisolibacter agri]
MPPDAPAPAPPGAPTPARPARPSDAGYFLTLDGWRAVAIGLVVADHVCKGLIRDMDLNRAVARLALGAHGVNLFFAISGFLITARLLQEREATGGVSLGAFYVRRAWRILPPAFAFLAVVGCLGLAGALPVAGWDWLAALGFWRNYAEPVLNDTGYYTAHFWSLAVEEHFYLLWPGALVALLLAAARRRRDDDVAYGAGGGAGPVAGVTLVAAMALLGALLVAAWRPVVLGQQIAAVGHPTWHYFVRTDTRLDALLWGAALAAAARTGWGARVAALVARPAVRLAVVAAVGMIWTVYRQRPTIWESAFLALLVGGSVFAAGARPDGRPGRFDLLGRALETGPARWLGRRSYGVYLWQQLFLPSFDTPLLAAGVGLPGVLQRWPWNGVALLAVAAASYRWVERPCIARGAALGRRIAAARRHIARI